MEKNKSKPQNKIPDLLLQDIVKKHKNTLTSKIINGKLKVDT